MKRISAFRFKQTVAKPNTLYLHRQISEFSATVRSSTIGNFVNAAVAVILVESEVPMWFVIGFVVFLSLLTGWRIKLSHVMRKKHRSIQRLMKAKRHIIINAACLGGLWGMMSWAIFSWGNSNHAVFAGIIGAGMMSAGVISYRSMSAAALSYIVGWTPGCLFGLLGMSTDAGYAAIILLGCYVIVLGSNIKATARRHRDAWDREMEVQTSRDTIELLLHDFSEQGSDWIMEVDRRGRMINPSLGFAEAAQRPPEAMDGKPLFSIFEPGEECDSLLDHFVHGRSFKSHLLKLVIGGETRWWSLSARPVAKGRVAYRGVCTDITAQKVAEEKVQYLAHYDALTDLPNRNLFNQALRAELRKQKPLAIMYLDLDNFKFVNDTLGHAAGDKLLRGVSQRMASCLREGDTLARLSGDEFAILLPNTKSRKAQQIGESIVAAMSEIHALGYNEVVVGTSLGIAVSPQHGIDADTIMANADLALYAAKSGGRNRAILFEKGMDAAALHRREVEMDLRNALGKNEMRLHYQPLVSTKGGETVGYEALIRWEHPKRGIVMPSEFITIAEETGLIIQLGEWVLRQAIEDVSNWDEPLSVSINLSSLQLRSPALISTLVNAIARHQVDPSRICIEITESVLMQDSDANIETLHKIRELGIQIALDDFGTGYSSLNYLRSFPFSKIKIDRCFIEEIDVRDDCQAIVRSVISLANSLGMSTTAEGVERVEQLNLLKFEGCAEVQGFLYSSAVPLHELSNLRRPKELLPAIVQFEDKTSVIPKNTASNSYSWAKAANG